MPIDSELRPGARRRVVRASRHRRQLPPRRVSGRGPEWPARSPGGADAHARREWPVPRVPDRERCLAFTRRRDPPTARGTATTSSCCASTPRSLARRARPCSRRSRPRAFPARAGYGFSLPQQPLFRNKAFGPYLSGASRQAGLPRGSLSRERSPLQGAVDLAGAASAPWIDAPTPTTSPSLRKDLRTSRGAQRIGSSRRWLRWTRRVNRPADSRER